MDSKKEKLKSGYARHTVQVDSFQFSIFPFDKTNVLFSFSFFLKFRLCSVQNYWTVGNGKRRRAMGRKTVCDVNCVRNCFLVDFKIAPFHIILSFFPFFFFPVSIEQTLGQAIATSNSKERQPHLRSPTMRGFERGWWNKNLPEKRNKQQIPQKRKSTQQHPTKTPTERRYYWWWYAKTLFFCWGTAFD